MCSIEFIDAGLCSIGPNHKFRIKKNFFLPGYCIVPGPRTGRVAGTGPASSRGPRGSERTVRGSESGASRRGQRSGTCRHADLHTTGVDIRFEIHIFAPPPLLILFPKIRFVIILDLLKFSVFFWQFFFTF